MNRILNGQILAAATIATAMTLGASPSVAAEIATRQTVAAQTKALAQSFYASPQEAANALYEVIKSHDVKSIYKVLGPGSEDLIYTGDAVADQQMRERFLAAYDRFLMIEQEGDAKATLVLGENDWPFPFPLVKCAQGWQFDAHAGAEEIVNRRIGANELFAMKFCLAYGDAQQEYAERDRDGDGLLEYAQSFRSSEGKRDGLFWRGKDGEPLSPLGPLAARAKAEGYSVKGGDQPVPYHGYFYRILTSQGKDARGGAYDYVVNGNMIGGYALIAYPARWGASGVMSFICSHDGVVYQQDLGEDTSEIALRMTQFNPDANWQNAQ